MRRKYVFVRLDIFKINNVFKFKGMQRTICLWTALASLMANADAGQPLGCLIEAERNADIGSQVVGIIEAIPVDRGDTVRKGQTLAILKAQPERAAVSLAKIRQDAEGEWRAAEAAATLADRHLKRTEELHQRNFVSKQALDQARSEAEVARQKAVQARDNRRAASGEFEFSQAQLGQRTIVAPFDGVVTERYMAPGERVEEKPIVRLAQINPLRVQVVIPISMYGQIKAGDSALVQPELPNAGQVRAQVIRLDKVVDPASNTFRALLRIDNTRHALPAGLRCTVDFAKNEAATTAKPAATTPPAPQNGASPATPSGGTAPQAAVEQQLQAWRSAWQNKDLKSYLAFYADTFRPPRGLSHEAWQEERRQRLGGDQRLEVAIEQLQTSSLPGKQVRALFRQRFLAGDFIDTSNKELVWQKFGDRWLIVLERQLFELR